MRHDQRQRILVRRLDVDEVDVHAVDLGRELRQRVQLRLEPAPVVVGRPVARERLERLELDALRAVRDELLGRPARRGDAAAEVGQLVVRNVDVEGADDVLFGCVGSAGRGSDLIESVIAFPLVRAAGQTDRAGQRREDIGGSFGLRFGRDRWVTRLVGRVSEPEGSSAEVRAGRSSTLALELKELPARRCRVGVIESGHLCRHPQRKDCPVAGGCDFV